MKSAGSSGSRFQILSEVGTFEQPNSSDFSERFKVPVSLHLRHSHVQTKPFYCFTDHNRQFYVDFGLASE